MVTHEYAPSQRNTRPAHDCATYPVAMADADAFDTDRARWHRPNPDLVKTAVLVDVADPTTTTVINAPFGTQRLRGPFYAVVEGDETYGAAKREFEAAHELVGANRWVKVEPVEAYQTSTAETVRTKIGEHEESRVEAQPGDWIVRQASGEIQVLTEQSFALRFEPKGFAARSEIDRTSSTD